MPTRNRPDEASRRRPRGAWRFRRCPGCSQVFAAGALIQVDFGGQWHVQGTSRCRCPGCGHVAPRSAFRVVRDARWEADGR